MIFLKPLACIATLTLAVVSGCASTPSQPAASDKLEVLASFYPLEFLSFRIGGDAVSVTGLTAPGAEPHDLELTPRQIAALSEAGLVVYEKGFQVSVDEAIGTASPPQTVDVSIGIELMSTIDSGHDHESEHDGDGGKEAEHNHESDHDETSEATLDPHIWQNPENMMAMADSITRALIEAEPAQEQTFTSNNADLKAELQSLDTDYRNGLRSCERREFITTHAAFGYLANRYELTQIPIKGMDPEQEASPARIAEIQQEAKAHGITTIFYETLVSPAVAQSIAGDLGLKTDVLDPIEGLTDKSKGQDYIQVMRANLEALEAAGGCS